ncbi:hypothetical protein [Chelatococcus asaccharovorans]|mgnify:CR=1 FL=1|uniref:Uncharacterized protein n=1 Tax=Chelatococcus asaccharovorans TaxID=28210 RepID=A0A2V3U789_9HYPH|nr:hypothetical protein [Chelatococcus asaccharovorans]MBS7706010.1 hypothetical protein [Chelatococcus asaccharovorans]PXW59032.1 hypothetical protein C7450_105381 [Chelatococcus asaccharovorans]CAH1659450.1 conserved membrane hypothetical protein [Chelatococcus asaccharovorans]CAH1684179.1 conserved membrane hypothetical protein [Chelatococcus asaccharovorans]
MRRLLKPLWFLLAVLFLVEAWLWDRLAPVVAAIVGLLPWAEWTKALAALIDRLPPPAVAALFILPASLLLPVKFLALWLLANEHWFMAVGLLLLAKMLGLGVTAYLFELCREKLLQLPWFAWLYGHILAIRAWAHRQTEPARRAVRAAIAAVRQRLGFNGQLGRRIGLLRRRTRRSGGTA